MAALPLQTFISQQSSRVRKYRVIEVRLGDGYSQRTADGLNAAEDSWTIVWENLTTTDRTTLMTFFDTVGSWSVFTWMAPGDSVTKKWRIQSDVNERAKAGNLYDISVKVRQEFDL